MRKQCIICNVTFDLSQFMRDGKEHADCNGCNCFQKAKPAAKVFERVTEVKDTCKCPTCLEEKSIKEFTKDYKVYRYCNTCRTEALEKRSAKNKELLGAFAPKSQTLCRCYRCGRISATTSGDFKISTTSETGYSFYCYTVCKGRRG
ncbi:HNH endonuclease [Serratia phage Moabite]|uniref:Uncharacterized protein n=3 Tax=Moabitevirus TaxID=2843422 RepID=A0A7T3TLZ0_9CAUD|nr:hypothetical protein HWB23_gp291 [Serratia phage vB_SmaM_ 2050HW]YP_009849117.1 HNH endonuclease [Serratia phage Moabite]QPX76796.1 hypothetical protein [Serratia phage vB_SmaM_Yaphecito]UCR74564.1 hypothetical protein [Serratia phage BUCT660]UGO54239.1 hypothetical protein HAYMO_257 [Serratia phage vB_SmaM_Haymo]UQT03745.1 hypothetical protein KODAMA_02780 [Serratia phage vB_SmaM-Kodama]URG14135.1 hypothetical protein [Pectobacterium phage vB_ParM-25]